MSYVFDTSPLSTLFKNYYPSTFRTLWTNFDLLVQTGLVVSTREVLRELRDGPVPDAIIWAEAHEDLFSMPTGQEAQFVAQIYSVRHFQQNIEQQKLLKGGKNADPFVIARAAVERRTVVTVEQIKPNGAKIPNICQHFGVKCVSLQEFMKEQSWVF